MIVASPSSARKQAERLAGRKIDLGCAGQYPKPKSRDNEHGAVLKERGSMIVVLRVHRRSRYQGDQIIADSTGAHDWCRSRNGAARAWLRGITGWAAQEERCEDEQPCPSETFACSHD